MTICEQLQGLRLYYLAENLELFLAQAAKSKWTHKDAVSRFAELETIDKSNRSTQQRLKSAKIGRSKLMNEFGWAWPKEIERPVIEELMLTHFIKHHQNIILAGSQGAGKTMAAKKHWSQCDSTWETGIIYNSGRYGFGPWVSGKYSCPPTPDKTLHSA